jgi:hypothetical protein
MLFKTSFRSMLDSYQEAYQKTCEAFRNTWINISKSFDKDCITITLTIPVIEGEEFGDLRGVLTPIWGVPLSYRVVSTYPDKYSSMKFYINVEMVFQ